MYKNIKNNPKYKLYYTDTDSIVVGVGKQQQQPTYFKGNIEAVWEPTQDALDKHKKDQNYELRPYGF